MADRIWEDLVGFEQNEISFTRRLREKVVAENPDMDSVTVDQTVRETMNGIEPIGVARSELRRLRLLFREQNPDIDQLVRKWLGASELDAEDLKDPFDLEIDRLRLDLTNPFQVR